MLKFWMSEPGLLLTHIHNYQKNKSSFQSRRQLSNETHSAIYNFWFESENSVVSNDERSERNYVRVLKLRYLTEYKHLQTLADENISEKNREYQEIHGGK